MANDIPPPPSGYAIDTPIPPPPTGYTLDGQRSASLSVKPYQNSDDGPDRDLPVFLRRDNAFQRLGNVIEHGFTFGLNTEVKPVSDFASTLATTGSLEKASQAYHAAKQNELQKYDTAYNEYGIIPEIVAGFGGVSGAAKGLSVAKSLGQRFVEGIPVAAGLGATAGATSSDGSLGERGWNALIGSGLGIAGHGIGTGLGYTLGKASGYIGRAISDAASPEQAAYRAVADRLNQAKVDAGDVRDVIAPNAKLATNDAQVSEIVKRSQAGQTQKQIADEMGLSTGVVSDRLQQFADNTRVPLNMLDAVKLVTRNQGRQGADQPVTRLARAAAAYQSEGDRIAAERLIQRQVEQPGRIAEHVDAATSGQNLDDYINQISEKLGTKKRAAYALAEQNPQPFDLMPTIQRFRDIENQSAGEMRSGLSKAIDLFFTPGMVEAEATQAPQVAASNSLANSLSQGSPRAIAPDRAQSIIGFLRSRGGVKPSGETQAINAERIPGLINRNGMTPDKAREALIEAGFMREDPFAEPTTSVADFHDLLGRAVAGEKIVREGEQGLFQAGQDYAAQRAQSAAMEQAARDHLSEIGLDPALYDKMSVADRQRIAERIAQAPEDRRLQEFARMHFQNGEMDTLPASDRIELAKRIDAGEDPHNVFEELAIRHENNRSLSDKIPVPQGMMPGSAPQTELGDLRFTKFAGPVDTLQRYQGAREALDQMIAKEQVPPAIGDKGPKFTPLGARLSQLRAALNKEVQDANPLLRAADQQFAEGKTEQKIAQAGQDAVLRAGAKQGASLKFFKSLTDEQKDLFRASYKQKLIDDALNTTKGGSNPTRQYTSENAQRFIKQIFEPKEAARLLSDINKENVTTETLRDVFSGSRTAPLLNDIEELKAGAGIVGDLATANVPGLVRRIGGRIANGLTENRAKQILEMSTNTEPNKILNYLDNINSASRYNHLVDNRLGRRQNYLMTRGGALVRNALIDSRF